MRETIKIFYNTKSGLYCRGTKKNTMRGAFDTDFNWKPLEKFYPRHQEKLKILAILEPAEVFDSAQKLPGIGAARWSRFQNDLILYWLYDDSWLKELPDEQDDWFVGPVQVSPAR